MDRRDGFPIPHASLKVRSAFVFVIIALSQGLLHAVTDEELQQMKRTMAAMEETIAGLKERIAVLEEEKEKPSAPNPETGPLSGTGASEAEKPPAKRRAVPEPSESVKELEPAPEPEPILRAASAQAAGQGSKIRDYDGFLDLQQAAPRPDNAPLDPKLKGFVEIPGTHTLFKIGGSARLDAIADFGDNGNPNQFVPSSIPVGSEAGSGDDGRYTMHGKGTRLSLEIRRPTQQFGNLRVYNENDFFGDSFSSAMDFRVRHFYGQAWNFLIGQTFSGFMNTDAWPDVVDYQGPAGILNRRQAQIRYTQPLWDNDRGKGHAYVSVEYPETQLTGTTLPADASVRSVMPDVVLGGRWEGGHGHLQLAGIGRSLGYESSTATDDTAAGWGVSLSGAWDVFEEDKLSFQLTYGEGIARYVNDFSGVGLDAALVGTELEAIPIFAPMIGYTHHWHEHWRSTIAASGVFADLPGTVKGLTPETTASLGANLTWQPTPTFRLGLEYLYGTKETYDGTDGDAHRVNFVIRYDLVD